MQADILVEPGSGVQRMLRRLSKIDWSFVRSSTLMSLGLSVGRLLGLLFWLVIARLYSKSETGHVRYMITLAELLCMATIPFAQHVIPWFISRHRSNLAYLKEGMAAGWAILLMLALTTLIASTVLLVGLGRFDPLLIVTFGGLTLFYAYFGLARGHLEQGRLVAAYIGSNLIQIVAVGLAVACIGTSSTYPILLIYGTAYLLPIAFLQLKYPLPVHFSFRMPNKAASVELLTFAGPMWVSHVLYTLFMAVDILILEYFVDKAAVGVYAVTRTLTSVFHLIPWAIEIMLMPRIAASEPGEHRRLIRNALILIVGANIVALAVYITCYRWFIETFIGAGYFAGTEFALVMALAAILFGLQGIVASILVGRSQPKIEAAGRLLILLVATYFGLVLVPEADVLGIAGLIEKHIGIRPTGVLGMAVASLLGVVAGLITYALLIASQKQDASNAAAAR